MRAARAGRVDASAAIPARVARRLRVRGRAGAASVSRRALAAAAGVVVAKGRATARGAGTVTLRLRPTPAAKRAAKRLRKVVLTARVSQAGAAGRTRITLR